MTGGTTRFKSNYCVHGRFLISTLVLFVCAAAVHCSHGAGESGRFNDGDSGAEGDADSSNAEAPPDTSAVSCPPGTTLVSDRTMCPTAAMAPDVTLVTAAAATGRGDTLSLGTLAEPTVPCLPAVVCAPADAPTLIFSNEPEGPSTDGALHADTVPAGKVRVFIYHTNGGSSARKFPVILYNPGTADATVTITATGIAIPTTKFISAGKAASTSWFASGAPRTLVVPAGKRALLDPALDAVQATNGQLVHAIIDFKVDAPIKVTVSTLLAGEDTLTVSPTFSYLPNTSKHLRGTLPLADRIIAASSAASPGLRRLRFGGGVTESNLEGFDKVDGIMVNLRGNYGLLYRLQFALGSHSALMIAPRAGAWGGCAKIGPSDDSMASLALLPSSSESLASQTSAIALGRFPAGPMGEVRLLSGGGSNLPVDLLLVPIP
ncbi:MAG: hypothetical protein NVSMB1_13390 [Polyangiales bacterium]